MVLAGQTLTWVSHASSWEDFASNRSISDALWHGPFTALDWMRPMLVVEAALPPHDDDGVLAVPPEHGAEAQPPN